MLISETGNGHKATKNKIEITMGMICFYAQAQNRPVKANYSWRSHFDIQK